MGPRVYVTSFRMLLRHMDINKSHLTTQCRPAGIRFMSAAVATTTSTSSSSSSSTTTTSSSSSSLPTPAATALPTISSSLNPTAPSIRPKVTRRGNNASIATTPSASPFRQNSWHLSRRHYSSSDVKGGELISNEKGPKNAQTNEPASPTDAPTASNQPNASVSSVNPLTTNAKEDFADNDNNSLYADANDDAVSKLAQIKVADLKAHMRTLGLSVSGNKQTLLQRLMDHRNQHQQQQQHQHQTEKTTHEEPESLVDMGQHALTLGSMPVISQTVTTFKSMSTLTSSTAAQPLLPPPYSVEPMTNGEVFVEFIQGLPHLTVPLPSRNEKCRFALMPVNHRVGDLIDMLKEEDRGIDRATVLNHSGVRIASTCSIESLMDEPFWLQINDNKYKVEPPQRIRAQTEDLNRLGDVRSLVAQLYEALHVNEYHISKEKELAGRLEKLQFELTPLEERKTELSNRAERRNAFLTWFGLGLMSVQFGILARLTWWEYSWDIMEPVTYFVTYGTTIAFYAYYCVTKVEYSFSDVKNREYLLFMHKQARKSRFDIEKYNALKREIADVEYDLRRLRDPLNMQMSPQVYRTVADQSTPPALGGDEGGDQGGSSSSSGGVIKSTSGPLKGFKLPFLETKN